GWCDIGYNFLVDKWGNVYEGRDDSGVKPVIGVHAGGFNTATVGISMLGTYSTLTPPAAVQESVARLSAWRLGQYYRDPSGSMTYHTYGGENSKYPAGTDVALPVIFAHRDVGNTACPGNGGYATLPWVRARATQLASPSLIGPSVSATSVAQGQGVTVRAATLGNISWRLDVVDARTGVALASSTGLAQQALGGVVAGWDGRNQIGQPVGTGPYLLTLSGTDSTSGAPVRPYAVTVQVTGSQNPPTVAAVPLVGNLTFVPITPVRALDTRPYAQSIGPDSRVDVVVAGTASVPADAKAVAVNITLVNPSAVTHVRAWPAGQPRPLTSVLNGDAARAATASGVVLGVGGEGKISLYNNAGSAHLVVDVTGYYTAAGGSAYAQLGAAARILDTRLQGGRMTTDETRTVTVAGVKGIPADARAVVMNVTSVRSSGNGFVSVVPSGAPRATTSTVNHLPGQDVTNRATVPLAGGKVDLTLGGAPADVVLDVVGWYGPGAAATFTPIVPVRAFDTRLTAGGGPLGEGATRTFPVLTAAGLPAGATGAVMTLTATQQSAGATFLTAWAAGAARPETSDLNTGRGRDQSNSVVVGFGTGGSIQVYNNAGTTQVIGDVFGYFR
ncbi:MAG TPA: N-acetylmuramoyl-L-alanine amidase, partial [Actinotalea sp.]